MSDANDPVDDARILDQLKQVTARSNAQLIYHTIGTLYQLCDEQWVDMQCSGYVCLVVNLNPIQKCIRFYDTSYDMIFTIPLSSDIEYKPIEPYFHSFHKLNDIDNTVIEQTYAIYYTYLSQGMSFATKLYQMTPAIITSGSTMTKPPSPTNTNKLTALGSKLKNIFGKESGSKGIEIGMPTDFKHVAHNMACFSPTNGFDPDVLSDDTKSLLKQAGIKKNDLRDPARAKMILDTIIQTNNTSIDNNQSSSSTTRASAPPPPPARPPRPTRSSIPNGTQSSIPNIPSTPTSLRKQTDIPSPMSSPPVPARHKQSADHDQQPIAVSSPPPVSPKSPPPSTASFSSTVPLAPPPPPTLNVPTQPPITTSNSVPIPPPLAPSINTPANIPLPPPPTSPGSSLPFDASQLSLGASKLKSVNKSVTGTAEPDHLEAIKQGVTLRKVDRTQTNNELPDVGKMSDTQQNNIVLLLQEKFKNLRANEDDDNDDDWD